MIEFQDKFKAGDLAGLPQPATGTPQPGLKVLVRASLLNLLLFGLFFAIATPGYETNDDLGMQLIASGFYTGHPSECLVFTNFLIGEVLGVLYGHFAGLNWYWVYLVTVHYASSTAIAFLVFSRLRHWSFNLLYAAFFLLVESRLLISLQFTTTASFAGIAGMLLFVGGLKPGTSIDWPKTLAACGFISLMTMIREPVTPLIVLLTLPFLCERFGVAGWRRLLAMLLLCAGLFLAFHEVNLWHYRRDKAWAQFMDYNELRGRVHRTRLESYLPQVAAKVGWSANDAWMFSNWYFAEPVVYGSPTKMRSLVDKLEVEASSHPSPQLRHPRLQLYLPNLLGGDAGTLMALAMLSAAVCLYAARSQRRRYVVTLLLSYTLFLLISIYLRETSRLPQRVSLAMPMIFHSVCLYWITCAAASHANTQVGALAWLAGSLRRAGAFCPPVRTLIPIWMAVYLFFLLQITQGIRSTDAWNRHTKAVSKKIFAPVLALCPDAKPFLVTMPYDSLLENCLAYYSLSDSRAPFSMLPYGWLTHSPIFTEILDVHSFHPFSKALLNRPDVFFLMEANWIQPLRKFYLEHYGLNIQFETVINTDETPRDRMLHLHVYRATGGQQGQGPRVY